MKKIFMFLSILVVGNMLPCSCAYEKIGEEEQPVEVKIDHPFVASKNAYLIKLSLGPMYNGYH